MELRRDCKVPRGHRWVQIVGVRPVTVLGLDASCLKCIFLSYALLELANGICLRRHTCGDASEWEQTTSGERLYTCTSGEDRRCTVQPKWRCHRIVEQQRHANELPLWSCSCVTAHFDWSGRLVLLQNGTSASSCPARVDDCADTDTARNFGNYHVDLL